MNLLFVFYLVCGVHHVVGGVSGQRRKQVVLRRRTLLRQQECFVLDDGMEYSSTTSNILTSESCRLAFEGKYDDDLIPYRCNMNPDAPPQEPFACCTEYASISIDTPEIIENQNYCRPIAMVGMSDDEEEEEPESSMIEQQQPTDDNDGAALPEEEQQQNENKIILDGTSIVDPTYEETATPSSVGVGEQQDESPQDEILLIDSPSMVRPPIQQDMAASSSSSNGMNAASTGNSGIENNPPPPVVGVGTGSQNSMPPPARPGPPVFGVDTMPGIGNMPQSMLGTPSSPTTPSNGVDDMDNLPSPSLDGMTAPGSQQSFDGITDTTGSQVDSGAALDALLDGNTDTTGSQANRGAALDALLGGNIDTTGSQANSGEALDDLNEMMNINNVDDATASAAATNFGSNTASFSFIVVTATAAFLGG